MAMMPWHHLSKLISSCSQVRSGSYPAGQQKEDPSVNKVASMILRLCAIGSQGDNKGFLVCKKKMATSADLLCRYTPPAFRQFTEAVVNLKFDEEPRYSAYVPLFEPLCGPGPQRPILLEEKTRVGQKRNREAFEGEDVEIVRAYPCP